MTTATETSVTTQVHRVYIKATQQAVWDAITDPDWTDRYGYGGRVEYDLRPGGGFIAFTTPEMRAMGTGDVAVDGEVIEADPPRRLVQTWRLVMGGEALASEATRLIYELDEYSGGVTRLTVIHELEAAPLTAALVSGRSDDSPEAGGGGWPWVLSDLKTLLETGAPFSR